MRPDLLSSHNQKVYEAGAAPEDRFKFDRSLYDARNARQEFEKYAGSVKWFEGEVTVEGRGPMGKCLVAWVDSYPLVAFLEPAPPFMGRTADDPPFCSGIVDGHYSAGGFSVASVIANMLFHTARNPGGRKDSDSQYLRTKNGKAGWFAFHNADPSGPGRTLLDIFQQPELMPPDVSTNAPAPR